MKKNRRIVLMILCAGFLFSGVPAWAHRDPLVQLLIKKGVITEEEIAQVEKELVENQPLKEETPRVDMAKSSSKLKLKGRSAMGYFDSGESGSYSSGSFELPDAKIEFDFEPDAKNTGVLRASLNNAAFNNVDLLYLDSKDFLQFLEESPVKLNSRIGRFKLNFGEELFVDNPVDSAFITNSAATVVGRDEGIQLGLDMGLKDKKNPLKLWGTVSNGNSGVGSDTTTPKAFTGKIAYRFCSPFYMSASYHHSGSLKGSNAEMPIAGLVTRPTNALKWDRQIWEVDARYDYRVGKILFPTAMTDSKAYLRLAYGEFFDDAQPVSDRDGAYGFAEGLWNLTPKLYAMHRSSFIDLDGDATATLNRDRKSVV